MRLTAAVLAAVAALAVPASASADGWSDVAKAGEPVKDVERVVWALTATCEKGDDLTRRHCRVLRDAAAARLKGATLVVDAAPGAVELGAFDPATTSSALVVRGCVSCAGVDSEGKKWHVVTNNGAPQVSGDKVQAAAVHEGARTFKDAAEAKAWQASVLPRLRTQLVIKVLEANYTWKRESAEGIAVQILGFRTYDRCDGSIVAAKPESDKGPADKKACGAVAEVKPEKVIDPKAGLPAELSKDQILTGLRPAIAEAKACYDTHGVAGDAKVKVTIGGEGTVVEVKQTGAFVGTPTGDCIEAAIKKATFPKSKKAKTTVSYPVLLR
jgi:hypothetical protein